MGDPTLELFDEANVDWVPFDPADPAPVMPLVRAVLERQGPEGAVARVEGPAPAKAKRLFGRRGTGSRLVAQVVGGRPGMPTVLTVGDETGEPVAHRFERAGIVLPEGWSLAAPEGTFPWVDVPGSPPPDAVVGFVVDALVRLGAPPGQWRAGIDVPQMVEHSHGLGGSHRHAHGDHHHDHGRHDHPH
jgi:hypothetical protein